MVNMTTVMQVWNDMNPIFFVFYHSRGSEVLRSFDIDTVFDVNAIVSHVLL